MLQVPIHLWNELAQEQASLLDSPEAETFSMRNQDRLVQLLDSWALGLSKLIPDPRVVSSIVEIYPMMRANRAIRAFVDRPGREALRQCLVDVEDAEQAADLMSQEHWLNPSQTSALRAALNQPQTLQAWSKALEAVMQQGSPPRPPSKAG